MGGSKLLTMSIGATVTSAPLFSIIGITQELTVTPIFGSMLFKIEAGSIIRDAVPYDTSLERNGASTLSLVSDTFTLLAVVAVTVRSTISVRDKSKSVDRFPDPGC